METLELGDKVIFNLAGGLLGGRLEYTVFNKYLNLDEGGVSNYKIFKLLDLAEGNFCTEAYGYAPTGGSWPEYKWNDFAAATRCVDSINRHLVVKGGWTTIIKKRSIPSPVDLYDFSSRCSSSTLEITKPKKGVKMSISIIAKKLFSKDIRDMIKAGYLSTELNITAAGIAFVSEQALLENIADLAKVAREEIKEIEEECKSK